MVVPELSGLPYFVPVVAILMSVTGATNPTEREPPAIVRGPRVGTRFSIAPPPTAPPPSDLSHAWKDLARAVGDAAPESGAAPPRSAAEIEARREQQQALIARRRPPGLGRTI
jgi:hypothetical protein